MGNLREERSKCAMEHDVFMRDGWAWRMNVEEGHACAVVFEYKLEPLSLTRAHARNTPRQMKGRECTKPHFYSRYVETVLCCVHFQVRLSYYGYETSLLMQIRHDLICLFLCQ